MSFFQRGGLGVAGEEVEEVGHVLAQVGRRREERQVGVDAGRLRVVVAGAEVDVAAQPGPLAAHHQRHLAVGLEAEQAVDHVDARLLEPPRPGDVVGLVEARLDLDDGGDLLAVLGGPGEGAHEGAVAAGPVQGLLDGEDVGVVGGLLDEADHRVEGLVGVVEQHLAGGDGLAHRRPLLEGLGEHRRPGLLAQLGARVGVAELEQVLDLERGGDPVDVGGVELERPHQRRDDGVGRRGGDLEPHRGAAIAPPQLVLHRRDQVLRLLLVDLQVPVAGDAEPGGVQDREAGEEVDGVGGDHLVEQAVLDPGLGGQGDEARQHRRHLHHRQQHLHVAPPLPPGPPQDEGHVERLVAELREGVTRVDRQRRQDREHLLREALPRRLDLPGREVPGGDDLVPDPGQRRADLLEPGPVLLRHQGVGALAHRGQHLGREQAVGRRVGHAAGDLLLQARPPGP